MCWDDFCHEAGVTTDGVLAPPGRLAADGECAGTALPRGAARAGMPGDSPALAWYEGHELAKLARQIVTQMTPAAAFYGAEEYHQRYLEKHGRASCAATIR